MRLSQAVRSSAFMKSAARMFWFTDQSSVQK